MSARGSSYPLVVLGLAVAAAGSLASRAALAEGPGPAPAPAPTISAEQRERDRPHTFAAVNAGVLALPGALVCPQTVNDCSRGELSMAIGIQNTFRYHAFGFGAGITWATTLRTDAARGDASLERDHSRRYFLVEAEFRYYALRTRFIEYWVGATVGGVVVNDSWSEKADRDPYSDAALVGPRAATLGTEGLAAGLTAGLEWTFARNWSFGPQLRYSSWFLPSTRGVSPTLDVASLSGRVDMFNVGAVIGYRLAL